MLKENLEHHPDVTRFAMENLELRGMIYGSFLSVSQVHQKIPGLLMCKPNDIL